MDGSVEGVRNLFHLFDKTGNGWISAVEIKQVLADHGESMSDVELAALIEPVDAVGNGRINFKEFLHVFCSEPENVASIRLFHNVEIWLEHSRYSLKPFFGAQMTRKNEKNLEKF